MLTVKTTYKLPQVEKMHENKEHTMIKKRMNLKMFPDETPKQKEFIFPFRVVDPI